MENKTEIFLDKYRNMEYIIKNKYHLNNWDSAITYLEKHSEFRDYIDELNYCKDVRNILSHKPKIDGQYCVIPSDEMIHLIDSVCALLEKPPVILQIATPVSKMVYKSFKDSVKDTIRDMNEHSFGNIPILEDGIVQGVLSEKAIVNYIVREKQFCVPEDIVLEDIKEYLLLENHQKEFYRFVKKDALISDVSDLFHEALNKGARIGMIFLTEHGKASEKILGIVTAWDLAGRK